MRILYQFPLSHFCEKARWLLDHKELDYIAQNLSPGLHRLKIQYHTEQKQLPVLLDKTHWIADSSNIAFYLDTHYPEHTLIRREADLREKILAIDNLTQELGIHVRRWLFFYTLEQPHSNTMDILIGESGFLRDFERLSLPALKFILKKYHQVNEQDVLQSRHRLDELIAKLNQILLDNAGENYLVGDGFSLADISVCSMLAPLMLINGTPWEVHQLDCVDQHVLDLQTIINDLALGQYVQRVYETDRNARVDWRGV